MKILINFASRSRPDKFFSCLNNLREMSELNNYTVLAKFDVDDTSMNNNKVRSKLCLYPEVTVVWAGHTSKIHAINNMVFDYANDFDIIVNHSDDFYIKQKGFDRVIVGAMKKYFPDTDGFLHFPDQYAKDKLCTYSIIGRVYYSRTNYIYHPAYKSLFCDNEATEVAKALGKYAFIDVELLEHQHPAISATFAKDALYQRNEALWSVDKKVYYKRKALNFEI